VGPPSGAGGRRSGGAEEDRGRGFSVAVVAPEQRSFRSEEA